MGLNPPDGHCPGEPGLTGVLPSFSYSCYFGIELLRIGGMVYLQARHPFSYPTDSVKEMKDIKALTPSAGLALLLLARLHIV